MWWILDTTQQTHHTHQSVARQYKKRCCPHNTDDCIACSIKPHRCAISSAAMVNASGCSHGQGLLFERGTWGRNSLEMGALGTIIEHSPIAVKRLSLEQMTCRLHCVQLVGCAQTLACGTTPRALIVVLLGADTWLFSSGHKQLLSSNTIITTTE